MDRKLKHVMIVGLGLIGGSIAKAIRRMESEVWISAIEKNAFSCEQALMQGVINKAYEECSEECLREIMECDLIYLCTGMDTCGPIVEFLAPYFLQSKAIITDVCSTKIGIRNIFKALGKNIRYIGGHPMAGSEKSGYEVSSPYLLENAIYVLCPMEDSKDEDLEFLKQVTLQMGAFPYIMDAEAHDKAMAKISHLPHIAAAALVNTAAAPSQKTVLQTLAAGGFKDITRIASGDPDLWKQIAISNRENIVDAIDELIAYLNQYRAAMICLDADKLYHYFESARSERECFETGQKTIMNLMYELNMDVPDRPGIIAEVSAKLSAHHINIRNIYIAESRDNELGCLRLAFDTKEARDKAAAILEVTI